MFYHLKTKRSISYTIINDVRYMIVKKFYMDRDVLISESLFHFIVHCTYEISAHTL